MYIGNYSILLSPPFLPNTCPDPEDEIFVTMLSLVEGKNNINRIEKWNPTTHITMNTNKLYER